MTVELVTLDNFITRYSCCDLIFSYSAAEIQTHLKRRIPAKKKSHQNTLLNKVWLIGQRVGLAIWQSWVLCASLTTFIIFIQIHIIKMFKRFSIKCKK